MSLYFPQEMADQVAEQAVRLDRSKSWVVQECVRLSQMAISEMEGPPQIDEAWQEERRARKAAQAEAKAKAEAVPTVTPEPVEA